MLHLNPLDFCLGGIKGTAGFQCSNPFRQVVLYTWSIDGVVVVVVATQMMMDVNHADDDNDNGSDNHKKKHVNT